MPPNSGFSIIRSMNDTTEVLWLTQQEIPNILNAQEISFWNIWNKSWLIFKTFEAFLLSAPPSSKNCVCSANLFYQDFFFIFYELVILLRKMN